MRVSRCREGAGDGSRDVARARAGYADHADAAAARGSGDGGDRLAAAAQRRAFALASASRVRLMCHCCTIDSRFCTTQ